MFTSLFELFGNRFFRIPNYQRGYAWVEEQRKDLWEDIASLRDGMEHYAGTIVLRKLDASAFPEDSFERAALADSSIEAYDVVDGQQRLTTLVILVNELLRFLGQNDTIPMDGVQDGSVSIAQLKERFLFRGNHLGGYYALDYAGESDESNHLRTVVFERGTGWEEDRVTSYMRNLQNASQFFHENIDALNGRGGREAVLDFLVRSIGRFRFNQINLSDDYNVGVAFETMNNRGLQLSNLELLKNRLLYLTELFSDGELPPPARRGLRQSIVDAWHTIYLQLGRDSRIVLNDDEFLKAHWSVYFMFTKRRGNDYADFLLRKQFVPDLLVGGPNANVIRGPADPHEEIPNDDDDDEEEDDSAIGVGGLRNLTPTMIKDYVRDLGEFSGWWQKVHCPDRAGSGLQPQVVDALTRLRHLGMGYFKPLLASALKVGARHPEIVSALFEKVERYYFKAFHLGTARADSGKTEVLGVARRLYQGDISLQNLLHDELWNRLENRDFVGQFKGKIADLRRKGKGFYEWKGIRNFLFEYNSELARNQQREPSLVWEDFDKSFEGKVSIEHILPQSPTAWYWRNQFRAFNPDEMKLLTGALGNLLPLSLHINIRLQNYPFELKKEGIPSQNGRDGFGGYRHGCAAEVEVAGSQDWSANEIYARSRLLMDFLRRRWNVEISDEDEREILGLEFVNDGREIPPDLPHDLADTTAFVPENETARPEIANTSDAYKRAFLNYARININERQFCDENHSCLLESKDDGRIHFEFFADYVGHRTCTVGFLFYSARQNPRLDQLVGPFLRSKIEPHMGQFANVFRLVGQRSRSETSEGVFLRLKLAIHPQGPLSTDNLDNLVSGYRMLKRVWDEIESPEAEAAVWNQNPSHQEALRIYRGNRCSFPDLQDE